MPDIMRSREYAERLVALAGDEPRDQQYQSVGELIQALWRENQDLCETALRETIPHWHACPDLVDEIIGSATDIDAPAFHELLTRIASSPDVPDHARAELTALLADLRTDHATAAFVEQFRRVAVKVAGGKASADRIDFDEQIRTICRLQLRSLVPELELLVKTYDLLAGQTYVFYSSTKAFFDAALIWFTSDAAQLLPIVTNSQTPPELRIGATYCLGCAKLDEAMEPIASVYSASRGRGEIELRIACIEAITYAGPLAFADNLIAGQLNARATFLGLRKRGYSADVGILLNAAQCLPAVTDDLKAVIRPWLQAVNQRLASVALLALERHGYDDPQQRKLLGRVYMEESAYLRQTPSPMLLMPFRGG